MPEWTAPPVERNEPQLSSTESVALEEWLDYERLTLFVKCAGLTADQLKERSAAPSSLSLLGLVRHMAEVERWWFRMHANGEDLEEIYCRPDAREADFDELETADAERDLATLRSEIESAKAAVSAHDLDEVVPSRGHHPEVTRDVRWIYIHMIEEYARHNGHANLLRERIDGATGD